MTVEEMQTALAAQLQSYLGGTANPVIENLQVDDLMHPNPTPPAIDIYPSSPFTESIAFGLGSRQYWFNIRARVGSADNEAGQRLLLKMMDDGADESVEAALRSESTYAGARLGDVEGPTEFTTFRENSIDPGLLGCTWRVALIP